MPAHNHSDHSEPAIGFGRRSFLRGSVATALTVSLGQAFWKQAYAAPAIPAAGPYGPLSATPDANGLFLPAGFTSRIVAVAGQTVPGSSYTWHPSPDGGACYGHPDGSWTYVSNSEVTPGGAGSITFDSTGAIIGARRILSGTRNNCAGGPTPWGTWISCEETTGGWAFDCDPLGVNAAQRLDQLGQRAHEAAAVDPVGKWIYTTEDAGTSRFYRWVANDWTGASPNFAAGGQLQALSADLTAALTGPTPITWVNVADLTQGYRGSDSSVFQRGEGCWIDGRVVYFCSTTDSNVWAVDGAAQTIECVYRGGQGGALTQADNVTVHAPSRDLFVAEDSGNLELCIVTSPYSNGNRAIAAFARFNAAAGSGSEVAGPAFSPDGTRLYVSSQRGTVANPGGGGSGVTYEITGPFRTSPGGSDGPTTPPPPTTTTVPVNPNLTQLFAYETAWKYRDTGENLTPGFAGTSFDDAAWSSATIQPGFVLGYGDSDSQAPNLSFGPNSASKYTTTYFRKTFTVADPTQFGSLVFSLIRDDGAVVYLNGVEVFRSNMPAGAITSATFAATNVSPERFEDVRVLANTLVAGTNVVAVEVHQTDLTSSDLAFKMSLAGDRTLPPVSLFPYETAWKYRDTGTAFTSAFAAPAFDDSAWSSATVQTGRVLGYGDADSQAPALSFGPSSSNKYPTTYFRKTINVADPTLYDQLIFTLIRDDGAVVYLNGVEVFRSNMPAGAITYSTFAPGEAVPERFEDVRTLTNLLVAGANVIAVEVHQATAASSDLAFKMKLDARRVVLPPVEIPEAPSPVLLAVGAAAVIGAATVLSRRGAEASEASA